MVHLVYFVTFAGFLQSTSSGSVNFGSLDPDNTITKSNPNPKFPVIGVNVAITKGQSSNPCSCVPASNCANQSPGTTGPRETILPSARASRSNSSSVKFPDDNSSKNSQTQVSGRIINEVPSTTTCAADLVYCCNIITPTTTSAPLPLPPPSKCGIRASFPSTYIVNYGQANFGEYPWQGVILTDSNGFIASAVLVGPNTILTVAHRIEKYSLKGIPMKVRLGDWNLADENEPFKYCEIRIKEIIIHQDYNRNSLENDIAVLKLERSIETSAEFPHINSVCLPDSGTTFDGQRCWVSGYGHTSYPNGRPSVQLREVDLTVVNWLDCQNALRGPVLGYGFLLNRDSFICAGGEAGKDACIGDGGSGLVCQGADNRFRLAGLVSWGLDCATPKIPGVYVNVANYVNWISKYL